jgi:hypothetical protein
MLSAQLLPQIYMQTYALEDNLQKNFGGDWPSVSTVPKFCKGKLTLS